MTPCTGARRGELLQVHYCLLDALDSQGAAPGTAHCGASHCGATAALAKAGAAGGVGATSMLSSFIKLWRFPSGRREVLSLLRSSSGSSSRHVTCARREE